MSEMNELQARRILAEVARRVERRSRLDPDRILFGPQRAFVTDTARNKAAVCSRRAGKSYGVAFMLAEAAEKHPRSICVYITMTRDMGKDILWPALQDLDEMFKLNLSFKQNTGDVVFPNGSKIIIRGADDRRQIVKLRGLKYPIAVVDEAQGFPYFLMELIEDILEPATLDYNGQVVVTGTPNAACAGAFYDITEGSESHGWSVHRWTLLENPHLPNVAEWLARKREQKNWEEDHPTYMREYRGIWVRDGSGLVFKTHHWNIIDELPDLDGWEYALGIDLGFNDPSAFVVFAFNDSLKRAIVLESYKEQGLIPSAVAAHVERLDQKYAFEAIVADSGGFGKGYVEEMNDKYGTNKILPADKTKKVAFIEMLNGDLQSNSLQIYSKGNEDLIGEIQLLQWDLDAMLRNRFVVDDTRFEDHLSDALLYGWRYCRHHNGDWEENLPEPGSKGWWTAKEEAMEAEEEARYESEEGREWWDVPLGVFSGL